MTKAKMRTMYKFSKLDLWQNPQILSLAGLKILGFSPTDLKIINSS